MCSKLLHHFNQLPNEIILKIFQYFDISDLDHQIGKVCQRWELLSEDASIRTSLNMKIFNKYLQESSKLPNNGENYFHVYRKSLEASPELKYFSYYEPTDSNLNWSPLFKMVCSTLQRYNAGITHLCIKSFIVPENIITPALFSLLENMKQLQSLVLSIASSFTLPIRLLTQLQSLEVLQCDFMSIDLYSLLGNSATKLEKLILNDTSTFVINEDYSECVEHLLRYFKCSLTELHLPSHIVTVDILEEISLCQKLKSLNLTSGAGADIEITDIFFVKLGNLTKLEKIAFDNLTGVSSSSLSKLFSSYNWKGLKSVSLSYIDNLTNTNIEKLASNCLHLDSLEIEGCRRISDCSIEFIIFYCKALTSLSLIHCRGIKGRFLPTIKQELPHLKKMSLDGCPIRSETGLHEINLVG